VPRVAAIVAGIALLATTPQPVFTVSKVSVGGIYDFIRTQNTKIGLGALASRYSMPDALRPEYGDPTSYMIFARLKIQ